MDIKPNSKVYFARILPNQNTYNVLELVVPKARIYDNYAVGVEQRGDKNAHLFYETDIGNIIFFTRGEALKRILVLKEKGE